MRFPEWYARTVGLSIGRFDFRNEFLPVRNKTLQCPQYSLS